jgi:hypothetical protein
MADIDKNKIKMFYDNCKLLETKLNNETDNWNKKINILTSQVRSDIKLLIEVQADTVNCKQIIIDEIRKYSLIMYNDMPMIKMLKKNRFEFYSTSYKILIKDRGDKKQLIEADIAKLQYKIDLLETHINYLRETVSNLETLGYTVKNRIQLLEILGIN